MSKFRLRYLEDFDVNSGVVETGDAFFDESPGLQFSSGSSARIQTNNMENFGITYYLGFNNVLSGKNRIVLGGDASGSGRAVDVILTSSSWKVNYVSCGSFSDSNPTVIQSKDIKLRGFQLENYSMYKVKIYLSGAKMKVFFNNIHCFDVSTFNYTTGEIGFSGIDSSNRSYISDINYYTNQCFTGRVTLTGSSQGTDGRVVCINQTNMTPVAHERCDSGGYYVLFVEQDSLDNHRYLLYSYVDGRENIQPKGISNLVI